MEFKISVMYDIAKVFVLPGPLNIIGIIFPYLLSFISYCHPESATKLKTDNMYTHVTLTLLGIFLRACHTSTPVTFRSMVA